MVLGNYNKERSKGQGYFNGLIKNEDVGVMRDNNIYGNTRTIYTLNNNGNGLYLYHYYGLLRKLYQYRKDKMEAYDNVVIGALFDVRDKSKYINKNGFDINIDVSDILSVTSYDVSYLVFMKQKELLEKYYIGKIDEGAYRLLRNSNHLIGDDMIFRVFFPKKIKAFQTPNGFRTDELIRVPDSVRILDYLVKGDLAKYTSSSNITLEQLNCFEFDDEPYDEIGFDLLNEMFGVLNDKNILSYSKEGIIEYAINQALANEEIMRLVKEK